MILIMRDMAGGIYEYQIQVSAGGEKWETVFERSEKNAEVSNALVAQKNNFEVKQVRYVKLIVTKMPNQPWTKYPLVIREFEIYSKD